MDDKQAIQTEIESKLNRLGETIETLSMKAEVQKDKLETAGMQPLVDLQLNLKGARAAFDQMKASDGVDWEKLKERINSYIGDLDKGVQEALAYYK